MSDFDGKALVAYFRDLKGEELEQIRAEAEAEIRRLDAAGQLDDEAIARIQTTMERRTEAAAAEAVDALVAGALAVYRASSTSQ